MKDFIEMLELRDTEFYCKCVSYNGKSAHRRKKVLAKSEIEWYNNY